jgi:uncharacterized phage infection (PIP) family protein YhgE
VSEDLELKVKADTGEAVAGLQKTEKAVDGVTKATDRLDTSAKKAAKSLNDAGTASKKSGSEIGSVAEGLNRTTGGFSKLMEATGKISLIFGAAVAAGKALAAGIDAISASLDKQAKVEGAAIDRKIQFDKAMRLAKDGTIALGHSTEEMLKNYDAYIEKMRAARVGTDETTEALKRQKQAFDELQAGLPELQKKYSFTILSPEDAAKQLDSVKALAEGLNNAFEKAFQAGGEGERDKWVAANEEAVKKVTEAYEKAGIELPSHLKTIAQAHDDSAAKAMEWASREAAAYDQVAAAAERRREKESAAQNFSTPVTGEFKAIQDAAVGAAAASGQFGTSLDVVAQKVVSLGGELSVGAPVLLNLAAAEDAVTEALYRRLKATKLLREEQMESLGVAEGWLAYISNIEASMAQGITSTTVGIGLLADFQRQLQTMFAGATGDAKKVIDDVTDAIRALIATATGGTLDLSPLGQLEREIERKRGGR